MSSPATVGGIAGPVVVSGPRIFRDCMLMRMMGRAERAKLVRAPKTGARMPQIEAIGQRAAPFEDFYHSVLKWTWFQHLANACGVYLLANALFAGLYLAQPGSIANAEETFENAFFFSVQTMSTIGYGSMVPATRFANILVTVEALFGTLLVAVLTGITFARFARPTARVLFSDKMVITPRDGVPHLMVRMANWRHNNVVEATLRMFVLRLHETLEGEVLRTPVEIPLVRDRNAVFWMSWTAMHRIDETSPLHPDRIQELRNEGSDIFLIFGGIDETFSTTIHARHTYRLSDIVEGARFVDILSTREDGTRVIDYHSFHEVVRCDDVDP